VTGTPAPPGEPAPPSPAGASAVASAVKGSRSLAGFVLATVTLALAIAYLSATLAMPSPAIADPLGPQIFPLLICAGLLLTAALLALEAWRSDGVTHREAHGPPIAQSLRVVGGIAAWTALYFLGFERLGFPIATTLFLAGLMMVFHGRAWVSLACAAGFSAGAWLLFTKLLAVRLPAGLLPL
jgi:putative tricarboxylic transport membrane protein